MGSLRDRVKNNKGVGAAQTDANAQKFIDAANNGMTASSDLPWEGLDKKAVPRTTFNLRLNDYELALLRALAEQRDISMQKLSKRLLIPALEELAASDEG